MQIFLFQLNAVILGPITGTLDIDKEGFKYNILNIFQLPQGRITIDDTFFMEDIFNIKNELNLETPFKCASEINSIYTFKIQDSKVLVQMEMNVYNSSSWIEVNSNYKKWMKNNEFLNLVN